MQFDWYILGTIISGLSSVFFGLLVFFYNRNKTGMIFLFFSFAFSLWTLPYAVWLAQPDVADALFWSRMLNLGAVLIPIFYIHWIVLFLGIEAKHKKMLVMGYAATALYAAFSFSPYFIYKVAPIAEFPFWPQANMLYAAFLFTLLLPFFAYGIYLVGRTYLSKNTDQTLRIQSKYIFIGSIMSTIGGLANFPLMFGIPFVAPQFTLLTVFHPMFWAYGSMRHKILNVKTIATEVFVFGLWVFILARTILFTGTSNQLIEGLILLITVVFGIFLIRSVDKEVEQREALAVANAGQENLIHIMNHQIKGFLGKNRAIFAELLSGDYGTIPPNAGPLLKEGLEQSSKGVEYVQDILHGASAATGTLPFDMKPMDAKQTAIEIMAEERPVAEKAGLFYESHIEDGDYRMIGDVVQIGEAFKNLITNAIKYNSPKGDIWVKLCKDDGKIIFSVKDTGIGVTQEDAARLFTVGGMGKNSRKINVEASGFGLAFVKGAAVAHKGKAGYRPNEDGKGSTFFIELPARNA